MNSRMIEMLENRLETYKDLYKALSDTNIFKVEYQAKIEELEFLLDNFKE